MQSPGKRTQHPSGNAIGKGASNDEIDWRNDHDSSKQKQDQNHCIQGAKVDAGAEGSRCTPVALTTAAVAVGRWSFVSLACALIVSGGQLGLVRTWLGAVSGV